MIPTDSPLLAAIGPYEQSDVLTTTRVTFSFMAAGVTFDASDVDGIPRTSVGWTTTQQGIVRDLFTYISTLVNLTFEEMSAAGTPNIEFAQIESFSDNTVGLSIPSAPGISRIVVPTDYADLDDVTLIHEIGHSLGLSHPFDGPATLPGVTSSQDQGLFKLNTELATRMSYTPGASADYPRLDIIGEASTYGALDIAALQLLYGANTETGLGDTIYGDQTALITIWDNGGNDTIDFSTATTNAVIDLRPATLAVETGGGGYLSFIEREGGMAANGGYTIAFGVEIENGLGGTGNDILTGNTLANTLTGGAGNDRVTGAVGNDTINGGAGQDTGVYSGNQSSYTLMLSAQSTMVTDRRGTDGTDRLLNIEALQFVDGTFDLDILTKAADLSAEDFAPIIELYIAYFNRAPDAVGLAFWGNAFVEGVSMQQMAAMFYDQDETRATYPDTMSNAEFVTTIYNNVLGRGPDAEGFAFWWDHLNAGRLGRDTFILDVLGGAKVDPMPDDTASHIANLARDKQYLTDKTDIGAYFAITKGMSDLTDAAQAMALFDGSQGSVQSAVEAIDGHYADALDPRSGDFLMPIIGVQEDPFIG